MNDGGESQANKRWLPLVAFGLALAAASLVYTLSFLVWLAVTSLLVPVPGMTVAVFLPALGSIPIMMVFVSFLAAVPALCVGAIALLLRLQSRTGFIAAGIAASLLSLLAISLPDGVGLVLWDMSAMNGGLLVSATCGGAAGGYAAWRFLQRSGFFAFQSRKPSATS
jgi:hypothetical protein